MPLSIWGFVFFCEDKQTDCSLWAEFCRELQIPSTTASASRSRFLFTRHTLLSWPLLVQTPGPVLLKPQLKGHHLWADSLHSPSGVYLPPLLWPIALHIFLHIGHCGKCGNGDKHSRRKIKWPVTTPHSNFS